jgi:histone H3/H4
MSSTTGTKRSRTADKDGKKSRSRSSAKKDKTKSPRRSKSAGKEGGKKRRSATKKDRKAGKSPKPTKRAKNEDGTPTAEKVKPTSARKIQVDWTGRVDAKGKPNWAIRVQPFRRLVNHYAHELTEKKKLPDMRLASKVARSIQAAVEGEIVEVLKQAAMMAMHAKRTTLQDSDVALTNRFSKPIDADDAAKLHASVVLKRVAKNGEQAPRPKRAKKEKPAGDAKAAAPAASPPAQAASAAADGAAPVAAEPKKKGGKRGKKASTAHVTGPDHAASHVDHTPALTSVTA